MKKLGVWPADVRDADDKKFAVSHTKADDPKLLVSTAIDALVARHVLNIYASANSPSPSSPSIGRGTGQQ